MKKTAGSEAFTDPILEAFDRLPAHQLLTAQQTALVLQASIRWLEDRRRAGDPPPWIELGGRMIRYAVGPLRSYIQNLIANAPSSTSASSLQKQESVAGLSEPFLSGGRKKPKQANFVGFVSTGKPSDEWPFVLAGEFKRPIDFVTSLEFELVDSDVCEWLTLDQYLEAVKMALNAQSHAENASIELQQLSNALLQAGPSKKISRP